MLQLKARLNWDILAGQYMRQLNMMPMIRSLRDGQASGLFSGSPIKIEHYMDVMKFLSMDQVRNEFEHSVRILDVGAYLNLFSDFINNFNKDVARDFRSTGIENSETMCEISRGLFQNNALIEGDVADIKSLAGQEFDVIILNNFFHLERPFPEKKIREIFKSLDGTLKPGGLMFYKYDNKRIRGDGDMVVVSSEGTTLFGKDFLPDGYYYSDERYNYFWYVIRKSK